MLGRGNLIIHYQRPLGNIDNELLVTSSYLGDKYVLLLMFFILHLCNEGAVRIPHGAIGRTVNEVSHL